jgi:hypothetical protein
MQGQVAPEGPGSRRRTPRHSELRIRSDGSLRHPAKSGLQTLRTGHSSPAALHPASRRRSCSRLHTERVHMERTCTARTKCAHRRTERWPDEPAIRRTRREGMEAHSHGWDHGVAWAEALRALIEHVTTCLPALLGPDLACPYTAGKTSVKTLPFPTSLWTSTRPPWYWATCLTMANPSPVPPRSRLRALSTR